MLKRSNNYFQFEKAVSINSEFIIYTECFYKYSCLLFPNISTFHLMLVFIGVLYHEPYEQDKPKAPVLKDNKWDLCTRVTEIQGCLSFMIYMSLSVCTLFKLYKALFCSAEHSLLSQLTKSQNDILKPNVITVAISLKFSFEIWLYFWKTVYCLELYDLIKKTCLTINVCVLWNNLTLI